MCWSGSSATMGWGTTVKPAACQSAYDLPKSEETMMLYVFGFKMKRENEVRRRKSIEMKTAEIRTSGPEPFWVGWSVLFEDMKTGWRDEDCEQTCPVGRRAQNTPTKRIHAAPRVKHDIQHSINRIRGRIAQRRGRMKADGRSTKTRPEPFLGVTTPLCARAPPRRRDSSLSCDRLIEYSRALCGWWFTTMRRCVMERRGEGRVFERAVHCFFREQKDPDFESASTNGAIPWSSLGFLWSPWV